MTPTHAAVMVVGGGLAGPEAAWQLARRGVPVELFEMRPRVSTPAHQTGALGELVCSNSLKSESPDTAPWLLKEELRRAGSLLLRCAAEAAVPGGQSLSVDRQTFSAAIEAGLAHQPGLTIRREEVTDLPRDRIVVLASGPLTSTPLAESLARLTGSAGLYFYDAISPIVEADSIDMEHAYAASRYGRSAGLGHPGPRTGASISGSRGETTRGPAPVNAEADSIDMEHAYAASRYDNGGADYLNCPLSRDEYDRFYRALVAAESYPLREFEQPRFFEACLPLEELARRGPETLRFGPMKPVGLPDPRTGRLPYAVVQLRRENLRCDSYNLVGFQNHLRFGVQAEVLRLIPALRQARFLRFGQVHRNSYVQAPTVLSPRLQLRASPNIFLAGQLCGTEGYVEAIATGLLAGMFAAAAAQGQAVTPPPRESALGSLLHYMVHAQPDAYVPANITFDLLPPLEERDRATRRHRQCARALAAAESWLQAQEAVA